MRMSRYKVTKHKTKEFPYLYFVTIFLQVWSQSCQMSMNLILWLTLKVMREEEEEEQQQQQQQDEIISKLSCDSSNLLPKLGYAKMAMDMAS